MLMTDNPYRQLPAIHEILAWPELQALLAEHTASLVTEAVREEIACLREKIRRGELPDWPAQRQTLPQRIRERLEQKERPRLRAVINATGILLHTNLGRAPLAASAVQAVCEAARGYVNLEMDLTSGERSSRQEIVRHWLTRLLPAESATAVNNNAAATVLVLRALAQGREVIVSRGELVEIGGSFRLPEIMQASGAILREVGTTNITRLSDYAQAISPQTALILRVHRSNFVIRGHTDKPELGELVELAHKHGCGSWTTSAVGPWRTFRAGVSATNPLLPRVCVSVLTWFCSAGINCSAGRKPGSLPVAANSSSVSKKTRSCVPFGWTK
jgi:L-seryl-tRNA(Ser) seleniumtransferase